MMNTASGAAIATTVGFAGLAVFQLLLAAGAPFGEAAWGGTHQGQLPPDLRVGSGIAIVIYGATAAVILARAGYRVRFVPATLAQVGSWVLVVLLTLGSLANFASQSPWERYLLGPVTLVLAGLCLVVARSPMGVLGSAEEPDHLRAAAVNNLHELQRVVTSDRSRGDLGEPPARRRGGAAGPRW
jgi:hypothetical protein